jgi:predicted DNA-binding protein
VSTAERPRKPRRKFPKKPYQPDQPVVSAKVAREKLELLRELARMTNQTVSDVVRDAIDARMPQMQDEVLTNDSHERKEGARDGP